MTCEDSHTNSLTLHWDSYDFPQGLPDESQNGGLLRKHQNTHRRSPKAGTDVENLYPFIFHSTRDRPTSSLLVYKNDPGSPTKPNGPRDSPLTSEVVSTRRFGIRNLLNCFCIPTRCERGHSDASSGGNCPSPQRSAAPDGTNELENHDVRQNAPSPIPDDSWQRYTEPLSRRTETVDREISRPERANMENRTSSYECNESCCSFHHWKQQHFSTVPRRVVNSADISLVHNRCAPDIPYIVNSKFDNLENRKSFYTLAYDCLTSQSSQMISHEGPRHLGLNECSSSNCSFLRVPLNGSDSDDNCSILSVSSSARQPPANMIESFTNRDTVTNKGNTALHRACIVGHDHIVKRLIEEGCSVDRQNQLGDSALHEAAARGYSRCVKALIEGRTNIGLRNKNKDTAIHLACANSHAGSLRLLLSSFPHSSPKNEQGDTPLHVAVRFGHVTCARVLISSRCTIDMQNKRGDTALHIATIARHRKLVRVLLDAGAQAKSVKNVEGKTPLDIAKDNDDGETAVMLISGPRCNSSTIGRTRGRARERVRVQQRSHSEPRKPDRKHDRKIDDTQNISGKELCPEARDDQGKVHQRPVIDQLPNPTPEIVNSITVAVENTKGELLHEIQKTNHLLEERLDRIEHDSEFRVARLDQITKERINAERMECLHRIDKRATLERSLTAHQKNNCSIQAQKDMRNTDGVERCQTCPIDYFEGTSDGRYRTPVKPDPHKPLLPTDADPFTVSQGFSHLEPYKTIKIDRGSQTRTASPVPIYRNTVSAPGPNFRNFSADQINRSDSAYGSLSPRHALEADHSTMPYHEFTPKFQHSDNYGRTLERRNVSADARQPMMPAGRNFSPIPSYHAESASPYPATEGSAVQDVARHFFENVTSAMEEWYERRLHEAAEKQQMQFDQRIEKLESKLKVLRCPSGTVSQGIQKSRNSRDAGHYKS